MRAIGCAGVVGAAAWAVILPASAPLRQTEANIDTEPSHALAVVDRPEFDLAVFDVVLWNPRPPAPVAAPDPVAEAPERLPPLRHQLLAVVDGASPSAVLFDPVDSKLQTVRPGDAVGGLTIARIAGGVVVLTDGRRERHLRLVEERR